MKFLGVQMPSKEKDNIVQLADYMLNAVAIVSADPEYKFIYVNPAWIELTGYSAKEAYQMSPMQLVHPDMRDMVFEQAQLMINGTKMPNRFELKALTKDNEQIWTDFFAKKIEYKGEAVILIVANDLTERKKTEKELYKSRRMLKAAQRVAHLGSIDLDIQTGGTICSDELYRILSIKPQSVNFSFKEFIKKIHPDDRKKFLLHYKNTIKNKKFDELYFRVIRLDGTHRHVRSSGEISFDEKGIPIRIVATLHDITELKKIELESRKSEELFRSLYENSTIGIYRTTPEGKILLANPAAIRMLGFKSFKELSKRNLEKSGYEPSYSRLDFKDRFETSDTVIGLESAWTKKDGKTIYVRESAKVIRDKNNKILHFDGTFEDITASKEAEQKLQSSEARMRHLLTSTSSVVYSLQMEGHKRVPVWVGDNIIQFGYMMTEVMKKNWWIDNVHPDDYEKAISSMNKLIENQHTVIEHRFKHKNGHFIWLRDEMVFIPDKKKITGGEIIGSWIDITKRKTVEEALKQSEESYRLLVENLTDSVFSLDEKGIIRYISPAGKHILGEDVGKIINRPLSEFVYPEDLAEWKLKFKKIVSGDSGTCDYRIVTKNNDIRYIRSSCRPVYTNNHLTSITGIMTDITVQKRNEEEINKLSLAVEQSPSSVIITDINGNIEYVNQKLTQVVGYSREELIGENPRIFKSGHMANNVYEELWSTILSGRNWHGELKNKRKDGSLILEDVIISPIKNDKGAITHFVGLREDVTKQRMLEEQLRQSQKMEAIGHLAGGVAHDFNNLLTVISGYSDLILRDLPKDHKYFEKLYQVKLSGQRAEGLTRQLLAFSRKQIMKPVVLDINSLISEMEKMLRRIIGEDIDLMTVFAKDLLRVKADPGQIEQVILNLVVNSRDAMPNGGKLIIETQNIYLDNEYVSYHPEAKAGMHIMISVSDTGCGMSKEIQSQIFEPFFSTKEKGKGTGLGLSTVYGIVMQSGGHIDMYSEPNAQTAFNIYLPSVKKNTLTKKEQADLDIDQGRNETILIVEDEETVRQFILAVLNKYNFNVLVSRNSNDAIKIAKTHKKKIHMLLTDVIMPGMSGKVLSEEIIQILPKIKIIFMSGYTDDAIVQHGVLEDGINFIQKPFTPQLLIKVIKEVLGQTK